MVMRPRDPLNLKEAFKLARVGLQSLILVNGGAAVGLLTFYGNAVARQGRHIGGGQCMVWGLVIFALGGVGCGVASMIFAYIVQLRWGEEVPDLVDLAAHDRRTKVLHWLAAIVAILSAVSFAAGVIVSGLAVISLS